MNFWVVLSITTLDDLVSCIKAEIRVYPQGGIINLAIEPVLMHCIFEALNKDIGLRPYAGDFAKNISRFDDIYSNAAIKGNPLSIASEFVSHLQAKAYHGSIEYSAYITSNVAGFVGNVIGTLCDNITLSDVISDGVLLYEFSGKDIDADESAFMAAGPSGALVDEIVTYINLSGAVSYGDGGL